ncbi:hypothetical protein P8452_61861 [Trifolium repens]|nr:hypothetical protein P8452_61861 [Trifolium repens]
MEEDVGRGRHGRDSRAHGSARRQVPPPPKRGRKKVQPPPVESGSSRSRTRRPQVDEPDEGFDAGQFLDDNANWEEPEPQPQEPPETQEAEDQDAPQHVQQLQEGDAYGEGPTDLSLLSLYHKHRAIPIWYGHPDAEIVKNPLRSLANGKKILDIPKPEKTELWFWDRLKATGLEPLVHTSFGKINHGLLTAFAERWHPETSTFHLPVGEMGITLDDVQCLLHIPIEGKFLNHERMSRSEGADMVSNYSGVKRDDIVAEFHNMRALKIRYTYLQQIYMELKETCETMESKECSEEEMEPFRERCVRAFLQFLVGCSIFSNKSNRCIDVIYLQYFQDLSTVCEWNWGAAALAYMQHHLDDASEAETSNMAGYLSVVQGWIIEHFPSLSVWSIADNHHESMPRCTRVLAKHLPERVLRQFKHVQGIPRDPAVSATPGMSLNQIDRVWEEKLAIRMIGPEMRGRLVRNPWDYEAGYIAWFYRVSHSIMRPVETEQQPPRPSMLEVLIEEQARNDYADTWEICQNVRREVRRSLADGEAPEGTPVHDTIKILLLRAVLYVRGLAGACCP